MDTISDFIDGVKRGEYRGDFRLQKIDENIYVEASVSDFRFGHINIRIWVEEKELDVEQDMHFRRLHKIDEKYKEIHNKISILLGEKNETDIQLAFEPTLKDPKRGLRNPSIIPDDLDNKHTYSFEEFVEIRDDITIAEAMMTNRENGMSRSEVEDMFSNDKNS
jgi:hypothetical protein